MQNYPAPRANDVQTLLGWRAPFVVLAKQNFPISQTIKECGPQAPHSKVLVGPLNTIFGES
jgi:hypothetical protein